MSERPVDILIDGYAGGGQVLRLSLACSLITGKSFRMESIRAKRPNPGLAAQHLSSIKAVSSIWACEVEGAVLGSSAITFHPGHLTKKKAEIDIGTAGSITLLLQAIVPAAIHSGARISLTLTGGTDVRWSMPIDFFSNVLAPIISPYAEIRVDLKRRGFYPKGGGLVKITIAPKGHGGQLDLVTPGKLLAVKGISAASIELLGSRVAERQAEGARSKFRRHGIGADIRTEYCSTNSVGSAVTLWSIFSRNEDTTRGYIIGADALGEKGKPAEKIGEETAAELISSSEGMVDRHLADNLIPYIAILGGKMAIPIWTEHVKSSIRIIETFFGKKFSFKGDIISTPGMLA